MSKHLTLHVAIQVAPENVDAFLKALRPCWQGCVGEPECLFFDIFQDPETPGLFRFVEVWTKDKEWFMAHQITKSYYEPYLSITQPMWIAERQMQFTERVPGWSVYKEEYLAAGRKG